jgi:type II restriction/modification system DNA methylase subunit YeeA
VDTGPLKKFAQAARRQLREQVASQLERVLKSDSAELREKEAAIKELKNQIAISSREAVIERVAYIWFNRFCALRFMDVNRYTRMGTVSPAEGFTQPEMLGEAKQGHIDESLERFTDGQRVFDLLGGRITSRDPQQEAYRLLLVAVCNYYNAIMPFLFEKIADYTELLMPDDLLSESSVLADVRETLTADVCEDVEVIGWLYQFYISEKKDEVFEDLKKNKKITPENIPAATQLFTPHWIVRYLVENSLGRLWMLNRPKSRLIERMGYYIKAEQAETDFLHVSKPEELRICDPACGSGHMLVYAFDLLYAIYEEEGYEATEIPRLILENNLYGIEIDERAGELAAFALVMKARKKYQRFFSKPIQPKICVLENIKFEEGELVPYLEAVGHNLFTDNLRKTLHEFRESNNFGSLIRPTAKEVGTFVGLLEAKNIGGNIFLHKTHERVLQALRYADYLSPKYHVVIANPPYMGNRSQNGRLQEFSKDNYPDTRSDLFAMFIERNLDLAVKRGLVAMITMQSWMFLSSFEKFRERLLGQDTISTMAHLGPRAFDSIGGEVVSTTAFVLENINLPQYKGCYVRLVDGNSEAEKEEGLRKALHSGTGGEFYLASASDFRKIPGSPIAYWVSDQGRRAFEIGKPLHAYATPRAGMITGNNGIFVRFAHEVNRLSIGFDCKSRKEARNSGKRWFPYQKGGPFRKYFGNYEYVVDWENDGYRLRTTMNDAGKVPAHAFNENYIFRQNVNWSAVSSSNFACRVTEYGCHFDASGSAAFPDKPEDIYVLAPFLNSHVARQLIGAINPTINFQAWEIGNLPVLTFNELVTAQIVKVTRAAYDLSARDWNSYETSWDFRDLPLLDSDCRQISLEGAYSEVRSSWKKITLEMQRLEEENNRIFIEAYGLQSELTAEVPLTEITLTCNPHYRYGDHKSEEELESLLLSDTMKEFISYAVGCMFGRYALDKPGLIIANQGETKEDYLRQIPEPSFPVDDDNVIPMLEGDWFSDDISERFRKFLRVTFGDENYQENLQFVEKALGKDIRKYFLKDFYNDHLKRYKKRPIYWLFSSPKGSFNALIYIHRYRPDTVSVVLNDYLREFRTKLSSRKNHLEAVSINAGVSAIEKTKALKEIENLKKVIDELDSYEREVLYPLATERLEINLDDGVKTNYGKFGRALKSIAGMASEED